jgi:hypothetical protein
MYARKDVVNLSPPEPTRFQRSAIDEWYKNVMKLSARTGDPPPPCVMCPYRVVLFCHETGTECTEFREYAGEYLDDSI